MLQKIVSGGQTGVDRGALDAALEAGFPCGGWCPKGRVSDDRVIPEKYPVQEIESGGYRERTIANVEASDGTAIIYFGEMSGGTEQAVLLCARRKKPYKLIDAAEVGIERAEHLISEFVATHNIETLNVAGPRESKAPGAHQYASAVLNRVLANSIEKSMAAEQESRDIIGDLLASFDYEENVLDAKIRIDLKNAPRHNVGHVKGHPFGIFKGWGTTLNNGWGIYLDNLYQSRTYSGMLCGMPYDLPHYQRDAIEMSESLFPGYRTPVILPSRILTGTRTMPSQDKAGKTHNCIEKWEMLPQITCIARFNANRPARDESEVYSSMTVIWWQDEFGLPAPEIVEQLKCLDWSKEAEDWTW